MNRNSPDETPLTVPSVVERFFDSYVAGFDKLDAVSIADHYLNSSIVVDATGWHSFESRSELTDKLAVYCENFKTAGYVGARYTCEFFQPLGSHGCFVDMRWLVELNDNTLDYKTAYTIHRRGASWQIGTAMVYDYSMG